MKHAAPPPLPMNTYRARPLEVQALDCGDGRHVLLTDPPRYMATADFLDGFELVEEKRVLDRRRSNGHGRPKARKERRAGPGRRGGAKGANPAKEEARQLYESGELDINGIHKKFKLPYSTAYSWSKKWKAPKRVKAGRKAAAAGKPAAAEPEKASQRRCRHCGQMTSTDGKWCVHCMENP